MIKSISQKLSSYLAENGGEKDKQQIYAYGIECLLNELISDVLLLIAGLITHQLLDLILWWAAFTPVRIHLGGYHASTHFRCITIGTILGICSLIINPLWIYIYSYIPLFVLISIVLAFWKAPISHKNHPISQRRRKSARIKAMIFIVLENVLALYLMTFIPSVAAPIFTGNLTAVGMAAIELIRRCIQAHLFPYNQPKQ